MLSYGSTGILLFSIREVSRIHRWQRDVMDPQREQPEICIHSLNINRLLSTEYLDLNLSRTAVRGMLHFGIYRLRLFKAEWYESGRNWRLQRANLSHPIIFDGELLCVSVSIEDTGRVQYPVQHKKLNKIYMIAMSLLVLTNQDSIAVFVS